MAAGVCVSEKKNGGVVTRAGTMTRQGKNLLMLLEPTTLALEEVVAPTCIVRFPASIV